MGHEYALIVTRSFNSESALRKPFKAPLPPSKTSNVSESPAPQSMAVEATESKSTGWTEDAGLMAEVTDVESGELMDISEDVCSRMFA